MRLAIMAPGEVYGGVERFVNVLAGALRDRTDVEPLVILFHEGAQAEALRRDGIEVVVPEQRGKYDASLVKKLRKLFRQKQIDIVHTNGYKATILGSIAAKLAGIPIVKTEHGKIEPGPWFDPRHVRIRMNLLLDEVVTRILVTHVVYVTHDLQSLLRRNKALNKSSIIYNGIDPIQAISSACPAEIRPDSFNIGMVGRIAEVKGHRFLLRALTHLRDLPDIKMYLIGEGYLKNELEELCHNLKLTHVVEFLGFKKNIYDYIAALDVLVMPSLHEGLPYVLLESMYLKTPVIASDTGGPKEVLEHGVDALLVEPKNERALADAIRSLHDNRNLRTALSQNAFEQANKDFTAETMVEEYLDVMRSLLVARGHAKHALASNAVGNDL